MTQSLTDLIINANELDEELYSAIKLEASNLKARLGNCHLSKLIDETINEDVKQAIRLMKNIKTILLTDYIECINNCELIGLQARIEDDELKNADISELTIKLFIESVYNSQEYAKRINKSREVFINEVNKLLSEIRVHYKYLPSLSEWSKADKSFHPEWLTNPELINNIELLLNSSNPLIINRAGKQLLEQLSNALRIVNNWTYCDYNGCNNFKNFRYDEGRIFCGECGAELMSYFSNQEVRAYGKYEINKKKMTEIRWRPFGPRTICSDIRDGKGELLRGENKVRFKRLSKIQNSLLNGFERNLSEALSKLNQLRNVFSKDVYKTAYRIYLEVAKNKLTMGRSIDNFIAASYYASLKINKVPLLMSDLINEFLIINPNLTKKEVINAYQIINNNGVFERLGYNPNQEIKLSAYATNYLDRFNVTGRLRRRVMGLIVEYEGFCKSVGKDPAGIIAASLYLMAKDEPRETIHKLIKNINLFTEKQYTVLSQEALADCLHTTQVTIRKRVKELTSLKSYFLF